MSESTNAASESTSSTSSTSMAGSMPAAISAGVGALACFLPWYRVSLGSLGSALDATVASAFGGAPSGAGFQGMGSSLTNAMGGLGISGTVTAKGVDGWFGVVAMLVLAAAAFLHVMVPSQRDQATRRNMLMGSLALGGLGIVCTLYGLSNLGGPVGIHVGLVVTLLGSVGATVFAMKQLQSHDALQQRGALASS